MTDREKQIEEMTRLICDFRYNLEEFSTCAECQEAKQDKFFKDKFICPMMKKATALYNAGYRKMDEITLKLDLGDRSAEEIQKIAEAFEKAMETEQTLCVYKDDDGLRLSLEADRKKEAIKKQVAKEILGELFNMAKMQGKHPIATPVNWVDNVRAIAYKHGVEQEV